jgi:ATP-binding cassette subfamily C protein/ATP-binding cassette subfamily C protein EexD
MKENNKTLLEKAVQSCRLNIGLVIFFSFFINMLMFVAPLHMLQVYDRVLVSRSEVTLISLSGIAIGLLVIYGILEGVRGRILIRSGVKFDEIMNDTIFRALFRGALVQPTGVSPQALRDMNSIRDFMAGGAVAAFCDAPWVPLFILAGFLIHPVLGLIYVGGAVLIFSLALLNEYLTGHQLRSGNVGGVKAQNSAAMGLRNAEVIQALGMISSIKNRWYANHKEAVGLQTSAGEKGGMVVAASRFLRLALQVTILGTGAFYAIDGEITPGAMIAASIIMGRALAPVEMAVGQWRSFVACRTAYRRLNDMLKSVPEVDKPMDLPAPTGSVTVENAIITAPESSVAVVKNVSIEINSGEALGLIGPSGSGKSTLARALVGVWRPRSGAIRFDGADLNQWDPERLGPFVGYIPQGVELFDGNVAENISRFGEMDSEKVIEAAHKAGVHEMILNLANGYETQIGSGGLALSGGQRQRIALARAVYGNPAVLVLDEPNANLDSEGENALLASLEGLKKSGSTIVVISHRPALLAVVDKIAVLKEGALIKFGPRDQVLDQLTSAPR